MAASAAELESRLRARTEFRRFARAVTRWIQDANDDPEIPTFASTCVAARHGELVVVAANGRLARELTRWVEDHDYVVQMDKGAR